MKVHTSAEVEAVRKQVRTELTLLGPARVRLAMAAFAHKRYAFPHVCCFLSHACRDSVIRGREAVGKDHFPTINNQHTISAVEANFEEWDFAFVPVVGRDWLEQECLLFLAEHGVTPEPAVAPQELVF